MQPSTTSIWSHDANETASGKPGTLHSDLVVVGTHGRTGIEKYMLGSVTEEVIREAEIDVLSVPFSKNAGGLLRTETG